MPLILVTSCSSRKSPSESDRVHAADLPRGSIGEVGKIWRSLLREHYCRLPVSEMYLGRGFREAQKASQVACAQHWIVSAGLGLVTENEEIPAYDLTISGSGVNQISRKIQDGFSSQAWWKQVARRKNPHRSITRLTEESPHSTVVLALPANYFTMILGDIEKLDAANLKRLRIIGPPKHAVPSYLQTLWLPYDERLDGPDGSNPGTRSDFPQRAARHFLEVIWPQMARVSAKVHAEVVLDALSPLAYPSIPKRRRLDDQDLVSAIKSLWLRAQGKSTCMLRILRDEERIACEQSRFKDLFHQVKKQMESLDEI